MNTTFRSLLAATALLAGLSSQGAGAQGMFPRAVGSGENVEIEYGPGPQRNILGGGAVRVQSRGGNETTVTYLDDQFGQRQRDGLVPVLRSDGENSDLVYLPGPGAIGG